MKLYRVRVISAFAVRASSQLLTQLQSPAAIDYLPMVGALEFLAQLGNLFGGRYGFGELAGLLELVHLLFQFHDLSSHVPVQDKLVWQQNTRFQSVGFAGVVSLD